MKNKKMLMGIIMLILGFQFLTIGLASEQQITIENNSDETVIAKVYENGYYLSDQNLGQINLGNYVSSVNIEINSLDGLNNILRQPILEIEKQELDVIKFYIQIVYSDFGNSMIQFLNDRIEILYLEYDRISNSLINKYVDSDVIKTSKTNMIDTNFERDQWYHFKLEFNNDVIKLFIDGVYISDLEYYDKTNDNSKIDTFKGTYNVLISAFDFSGNDNTQLMTLEQLDIELLKQQFPITETIEIGESKNINIINENNFLFIEDELGIEKYNLEIKNGNTVVIESDVLKSSFQGEDNTKAILFIFTTIIIISILVTIARKKYYF